MAAERLQKVLAATGIASRRGSEELIAAGRVTVDGVVATIGQQVDAETAAITVDGRPVGRVESPSVYVALHKPAGVTSTVRDRHANRTVLDLVPPDVQRRAGRLYPVGRLDRDSEGLLLLTNDGAWADRVLHPRHGVDREYAIGLSRLLDVDQQRALEQGVQLEEGLAVVQHLRPATRTETRRLEGWLDPQPPPLAWYRGTLRQGWKRQLRRMFAAVGEPIDRLVRVRIGTVRIDDLRTGESRELSSSEARRLAGLGRLGGFPKSSDST